MITLTMGAARLCQRGFHSCHQVITHCIGSLLGRVRLLRRCPEESVCPSISMLWTSPIIGIKLRQLGQLRPGLLIKIKTTKSKYTTTSSAWCQTYGGNALRNWFKGLQLCRKINAGTSDIPDTRRLTHFDHPQSPLDHSRSSRGTFL